MLRFGSFIEDIVSSCEDSVSGYEESTSNSLLLVGVEESKGADGALKDFLESVFFDLEELLVGKDSLVAVARLLVSHQN